MQLLLELYTGSYTVSNRLRTVIYVITTKRHIIYMHLLLELLSTPFPHSSISVC